MKYPSYSVLIPAYNAENSIGDLITQLRQLQNAPAHIIVIDDGSSDNTKLIVEENRCSIFSFENNGGKGRALQKGFEIFIKNTKDTYLICMDADLQHSPKCIPIFLEQAGKSDGSLIIGNREIHPVKMPIMRYFSNKITSLILSVITKQKIKDSQCGFRLIPRKILQDIHYKENGFQFESEFIIKCSKYNITVLFVDIPTIYNDHGSNINKVGDTIKFMKLVFRELFS